MKKIERIDSKLFENNILNDNNLESVKGGGSTTYKDGRIDQSFTSDNDKCWSIGTADKEIDCSSFDLGGDDLNSTNSSTGSLSF